VSGERKRGPAPKRSIVKEERGSVGRTLLTNRLVDRGLKLNYNLSTSTTG